MNDASEQRRASVLVVFSALLWSTGGLGVRSVDETGLTIAGVRALVATLAMLVVARFRQASLRTAIVSSLRRPTVWMAACAYAVMVVCFCVAVKNTSVANAILLQYTGPVYVALLSWPLLRERVRATDWIAIALSLCGMIFFFRGQITFGQQLGNAIALISALGAGALPVFLRLDRRRANVADSDSETSALLAMALGNGIAAAVCLPAVLTTPPHTPHAWLVLTLLGVGQIAIPYVLYARAIRYLTALRVSLVAMIEPILSPLWVFLFRGEAPSRSAVVGGVIILASVVVQMLVPRSATYNDK